jgi:hypothetical protein
MLVLLEVSFETILGDKHDIKSYIRLTLKFLLAIAMGLLVGNPYSIVTYLLIRVAFFDVVFGKLFKDDWWYLGNTSPWDKKIKSVNPKLLIAIRVVSFVASLIINI